jgi:hypothetical protein
MIRPTLAVSRPLIGKNSAEVVTGESTNFCRN